MHSFIVDAGYLYMSKSIVKNFCSSFQFKIFFFFFFSPLFERFRPLLKSAKKVLTVGIKEISVLVKVFFVREMVEGNELFWT